MSATFSKVSTRIWPIWDLDHGGGHVPIVWLMHDLSVPTVFSVRLNDTEVRRQIDPLRHASQNPNGPPAYSWL
jgi:hypothetical protein